MLNLDGSEPTSAVKPELKTLSIDPATLVMAALLVSIDRKLDAVQETQEEILGFLVQKEKSQLRGDLNFLSDALSHYKFNWNNEKYKNSNYIKVLDIKQTSEQSIDFYSEQIKTQLGKRTRLIGDKDVAKFVDRVRSEFGNYQLALYLFAFASLVEILLLENFESPYLKSIVSRIQSHRERYSQLYEISYDRFEEYSKSSLQTNVLKGLAGASKIAGKTLAKVPGMGDSKLDTGLRDSGEKLADFVSKRAEETVRLLGDNHTDFVQPFVDNIETIDRLHNEPLELVVDKEKIYFSVAEEAPEA